MANVQYTDDAFTTVASNISTIATSISVASSSSFPALSTDDYFYATLRVASSGAKETVKVTAISGTTWTVARAEGPGESALSFVTGDEISLRVGKNLLDAMLDDYPIIGTAGNEIGTRTFTTAAAMKAATNVVAGMIVQTHEHTTGYGYSGGNEYRARAVTGASDDNGSVIKSTGDVNLEFVGLFRYGVFAAQFGAPEDNTSVDSSTALLNMIAHTYEFTTAPGSISLDETILLWDKGQRNTTSVNRDYPGTVWNSRGTKIVAGSTIGVASDEPLIEMGFHSVINGHLTIDGNSNANIIGIRFGHYNGTNIDPSWLNTVQSVQSFNCKIGMSLYSDSTSGCYRNTIGTFFGINNTTGLQLLTTTGINKVNDNHFSVVVAWMNDYGVNIKAAGSNSFDILNSEDNNILNLLIENVQGLFVNGGHMEIVLDSETITSIGDDGTITVLTVSTRNRVNGESVRITGTSTDLDNNVYVVEQAASNTYKLTGGPTGITGSAGTAFNHPGRNLQIDDDCRGIHLRMSIANMEDIIIPSYAVSNGLGIDIQSQALSRYYGRTEFERIDIGARNSVTGFPEAAHDQSVTDRLRVSGGQYCYAHSSGNRFYYFEGPAVTSGDDVGWIFRNDDGERIRIYHDGGLRLTKTGATCDILHGSGAPSGAPAASRAIYIRTDGGTGTTIYYWNSAAWIAVVDTDTDTDTHVISVSYQSLGAGSKTDECFFIATRAYRVLRIAYSMATTETTTSPMYAQVVHDTSTGAPGSGTDLLTNNANNGFNCNATANNVQAGTLIGSLDLAQYDRLSVDYTAAGNEIAGVTITVDLLEI